MHLVSTFDFCMNWSSSTWQRAHARCYFGNLTYNFVIFFGAKLMHDESGYCCAGVVHEWRQHHFEDGLPIYGYGKLVEIKMILEVGFFSYFKIKVFNNPVMTPFMNNPLNAKPLLSCTCGDVGNTRGLIVIL